jgi:drug/metabolite transporter (DMT)-like permease
VLLAVASTAVFAVMHALVRQVASSGLHAFEIAFFRSLFGALTIAPLLVRAGWIALRTAQPRLQVARAFLGAISMTAWFYGLGVVPIAEATALSFCSAIFASLGAVLFLGERMGARRWSAVATALVGALVILRPGLEAVQPGSLFVVLSAVTWGTGVVIVKKLSATDTPVAITAWMAISLTVVTAVPATLVWVWPSPMQLALLIIIGVLGTTGTLLYTHAMRLTEATVVIPIDFTRLIWASAIGFFVFAESPDLGTWLGGALIMGSTVYIAWREAKLRRQTAPDGAMARPGRRSEGRSG